MVHPYSSIATATAWKKSHFILLDRLDFYITDNLSIAFYIFARDILTSLSIDEMLLLKYVNYSTNFRALSFRAEMAPSQLKHMNSALFVLM